MPEIDPKLQNELFGLSIKSILNVFDELSAGIIITDALGTIVYYNQAIAKIDGCEPENALYRKHTEVYDQTENTSLIMKCLNSGQSIIDQPFYYRTRIGRIANTSYSIFPLFKNKRICGVICIVREYTVLEKSIRNLSAQKHKTGKCGDTRYSFDSIFGDAPQFKNAVDTARMAANTSSPIMLYGETGTGKELFAQAIHNHSDRHGANYIPVNCAAIPENLLEGILFGTSKGAFTGATDKPGLFEQANGGTIFLDELNSMAVGLQAKILRVIQEHKVRRLGSLREIDVDLKIISSVNQQPHIAIAENQMRPDLFYRLGVVFIPIPPLRDRPGDIERLAHHFLVKHRRKLRKAVAGISKDVLDMFNNYHWPGNVRELEHAVEGAVIFVKSGDLIGLDHLQSHLPIWFRLQDRDSKPGKPYSLSVAEMNPYSLAMTEEPECISYCDDPVKDPMRTFFESQSEREKKLINAALLKTKGNVTESAKCIGISRQLLYYKMKKHMLNRGAYL